MVVSSVEEVPASDKRTNIAYDCVIVDNDATARELRGEDRFKYDDYYLGTGRTAWAGPSTRAPAGSPPAAAPSARARSSERVRRGG